MSADTARRKPRECVGGITMEDGIEHQFVNGSRVFRAVFGRRSARTSRWFNGGGRLADHLWMASVTGCSRFGLGTTAISIASSFVSKDRSWCFWTASRRSPQRPPSKTSRWPRSGSEKRRNQEEEVASRRARGSRGGWPSHTEEASRCQDRAGDAQAEANQDRPRQGDEHQPHRRSPTSRSERHRRHLRDPMQGIDRAGREAGAGGVASASSTACASAPSSKSGKLDDARRHALLAEGRCRLARGTHSVTRSSRCSSSWLLAHNRSRVRKHGRPLVTEHPGARRLFQRGLGDGRHARLEDVLVG